MRLTETDGKISLKMDNEELPTISIPRESEESLMALMISMEAAGLFDEGNSFKVDNVSNDFFEKLNGRLNK